MVMANLNAAEKPKHMASPETSSGQWQARTKIAQQQGMGESAPDWLMNSESYAIYHLSDWAGLAQSKVSFITHCPVNRDYFARARAMGIRTFPYVTFFHANSHGGANMFFTSGDLRVHPDWIQIDENGNRIRSPFWVSEDMKNEYKVCPNDKDFQDAMVAYVQKLMEMGADGIFLDVVVPQTSCYGPKFGVHQHMFADQNQAFANLLKRTREVIKKYRPDGALICNSGYINGMPKEYLPYMDADMAESYILTWVSTDRLGDWKDWQKKGHDLQPYIRAGKAIQALSYLGHTPYGIRNDAYFAYATARLSGLVWNGGLPLSNPETADIYRLRLGAPLTGEREENGVYYRAFERGLVAVNPDKTNARAFTIAAPIPSTKFLDMYGGGMNGWNSIQQGYSNDETQKQSGASSIKVTNPTTSEQSGALQFITINQEKPKPLVLSGWSKAENVSGEASGDYSLYVDLIYTDGTPLWGQIATFDTGTHDWQQKSFIIRPEKPIRSASVNLLLRNKSGTVWFDNVSLREEGGPELIENGAFEDANHNPRLVDVSKSGGRLEIPAYSGRVFLYDPEVSDELARTGPTLSIKTNPALGNVRFKVDGFDMWTHSGRWTTEYILGYQFGQVSLHFEKPGKHTIEIVDIVPDEMKMPTGYGSGENMNKSVSPANPNVPSDGRKFHFTGWEGHGTDPKIEVDLDKDATLVANFEIEK
jgi:hypothetical protein